MQLRKNVYLGASFERLKLMLDKSNELGRGGAENKARGLGLLQGAIKVHLAECTDETDDLPDYLFSASHPTEQEIINELNNKP